VDVDADALTAILADRLGKIVPAGFHVEARDGMLWYSADSGRFPGQGGEYCVGTSGTFVRDNLEARGETAEDRIAAFGYGTDARRLAQLPPQVSACRAMWSMQPGLGGGTSVVAGHGLRVIGGRGFWVKSKS
jgi:hypothetical protein